jgi:hypothetical protein
MVWRHVSLLCWYVYSVEAGWRLQMVSCGADKSIIFRQLQATPGGTQCQFSRGHNIAGKTTLYGMEVDWGQKHILTGSQHTCLQCQKRKTQQNVQGFSRWKWLPYTGCVGKQRNIRSHELHRQNAVCVSVWLHPAFTEYTYQHNRLICRPPYHWLRHHRRAQKKTIYIALAKHWGTPWGWFLR